VPAQLYYQLEHRTQLLCGTIESKAKEANGTLITIKIPVQESFYNNPGTLKL
jgi:hypothetical protein